MTSKVYRPEMSLYRDGQFWPSGKIPMVGAGSFNQHLDPCFTNSALPPPIFSRSLSQPAQLTGVPLLPPQQVIYV